MKLTKLIKAQIGNGGKKYWKYAGFTSRIEWCGAFVWWCLKHCDEKYEYMKASQNPFYVPNIEAWAKKNKRTVKKANAKRGDIVTFDWNGNDSGDHVGFIWDNHGTWFTTIEGNTGGGDGHVLMRTRYASQINKVIRLKKVPDKADAPAVKADAPGKSADAPVKTEKIDCKYKVLPSDGMNVRKSYTKNSKRVGGLVHGATFRATMKHGNWVYAPEMKGWVCIKGSKETYLKKVK